MGDTEDDKYMFYDAMAQKTHVCVHTLWFEEDYT